VSSGTVLHVCVSTRKAAVKEAVPHAVLRAGYGIEGDAHAGAAHRQLSLLDAADIEALRAAGRELEPGAFGENFVTGGLNLEELGVGTRLRIGSAEIEVTQVGKNCRDRCAIYYHSGECIMHRVGVFARVVRGGDVEPGARIEVIDIVSRETIQVAVLTVSDRCAEGLAEDTAGPAASELLMRELGSRVSWAGVVPDETETISTTLTDLLGRGFDLIVTVGGTGCGPRDVTPEATRSVIEREVPGLAEAMRTASARITPHALLQRGVAGIAGATLVLNLPGSKKAAVENLAVILPALPHAVGLLRGEDVQHSTEAPVERS
jgi:molybdopterin adenylyltransferase